MKVIIDREKHEAQISAKKMAKLKGSWKNATKLLIKEQ